ncbi:MAG: DUF4296 domain-containing protein [Dysgonomonas sp.]
MQRSVIYIIIIIVIATVSCSRRPGYVIPEQKMMDVLYDIQLSQAIYRSNTQFGSNESKDALVEGVLKKYKITQAELDSSLVWYSDNIQYYMIITDSVAARLKLNNERLIALKNELNAKTRNWDNLIIPPFFYLNESTPTLSFNIDSSKIKTIDLAKFNIRFRVQGLNKDQNIEAAFFYKYKDTLIKQLMPIDSNIQYLFTKPQLADSLLKNISGYIHMRNSKMKLNKPGVILYNISYSDSIQSDSLTIPHRPTPPSLSSGELKVAPVAPSVNGGQNDLKTKTREDISDDTDKNNIRRDKMPVLSRDRVNSSPTMRQSKKSGTDESQKE